MNMLHPENVEINITGDFDPAELKQLALTYLGTVAPRPQPPVVSTRGPQLVQPPAPIRVQWHLKDSDERACAYIAGKAPARWYSFGKAVPHSPVTAPMMLTRNSPPQLVQEARDIRRRHPLYPMVTLNLLTEIINGRLFTTVRDSLGLTYDVSFEVASFDRLGAGWFVVNVTSTPNKIQEAMDASLRVLRNTLTDRVTSREVLRARRTVLTRHESDMKVWLAELPGFLPVAPPVCLSVCLSVSLSVCLLPCLSISIPGALLGSKHAVQVQVLGGYSLCLGSYLMWMSLLHYGGLDMQALRWYHLLLYLAESRGCIQVYYRLFVSVTQIPAQLYMYGANCCFPVSLCCRT